MQYWIFIADFIRIPTVSFTAPIPGQVCRISIIALNWDWFDFFFGRLTETFLAHAKIASNWRTARVDKYLFYACSAVSMTEI